MYVVIKGDLKKNQCQQPSRKLINHYHQLLKQKEDLKLQLSEVCCVIIVKSCHGATSARVSFDKITLDQPDEIKTFIRVAEAVRSFICINPEHSTRGQVQRPDFWIQIKDRCYV